MKLTGILSYSIITAISFTAVFASSSPSTSSIKQRRAEGFKPSVLQPASGTSWVAGQSYTVSWDVANIQAHFPLHKRYMRVGLNRGDTTVVASLKDGVDILPGSIGITLPATLEAGSGYRISVSGSLSQEFTITSSGGK